MNFFSGLQESLNKQGFHIVGYGCTTCIGNSGDLHDSVSAAISENGMNLVLSIYFSPDPVLLIFNMGRKQNTSIT